MINSKKVLLFYFSGTGNTFLAAKGIAEELSQSGCEVSLLPITIYTEIGDIANCTIGLAMPVAAFTTYPFVWKFINRLPAGKDQQIFTIATKESTSFGLKDILGKDLRQKGYKLYGYKEFKMPSNFFNRHPKAEKNNLKLQAGLNEVKKFSADLISGNCTWQTGSTITKPLLLSNFMWKCMRKITNFRIEREQCINCKLCYQICPTGNIIINESGEPEFQDKCELCMRCVSFCPENAIKTFPSRKERYTALESALDLTKEHFLAQK